MTSKEALENMHKLFLEALRHREQEIVPYLAIIGPALGGFIWLLIRTTDPPQVFVAGTIGVLFLLLVGAVYSLALGYNFRYITLQLAKLEDKMKIMDTMLAGWPRDVDEFRRRYVICRSVPILRSVPWCTPPEIIKIFWMAFLAAMAGVAIAACVCKQGISIWSIIIPAGAFFVIGGLIYPLRFGRKLRKQIDKEIEAAGGAPPAAP